MLLSFSVPAMLPYIEAGIRQANGKKVGRERVKRQTIRQRGPRAELLLKQAGEKCFLMAPLDMWWKSRTKEKRKLGYVVGFHIFPILILRTPSGLTEFSCDVEEAWPAWIEHVGSPTMTQFARADGFASLKEFENYFVPNPGDRFRGAIFKW